MPDSKITALTELAEQPADGDVFPLADISAGVTKKVQYSNLVLNIVRNNQANTFSAGAQDFSGVASMLLPASAAYAPTAAKSIGYDSTQKKYVAGGGTGTQTGSFPRVMSVQFSTTDLIDFQTASTNETAFATTYTIPANFFIANKVLRVSIGLDFIGVSTIPTMLFTMRVQKSGPTNVNLYTGSAQAASNTATRGFGATFLIQGTAAVGSSVSVETALVAATGPTGTTATLWANTVAQGVSIDTTAQQALQFTLKYGSGGANGNITKLRQLLVEELN